MADGITRIAVEGFKSISKRQSIEIAPLTILAGANSSGKSSIMQPLLMLKQTLEQTTDPGPLWIGGPNVKFTSTDQFFSKTIPRRPQLAFEIATLNLEFEISLVKGETFAVEILKERCVLNGAALTLRPGMTSDEIWQMVGKAHPSAADPYQEYSLSRNRFFLDVQNKNGASIQFMEGIEAFVRDVIHVPGLRGNPERTYRVRAVGATFPGTFEDYTASVINTWQSEENTNSLALNRDLEHVGLVDRVVARRLNDVDMDLQVGRLANGKVYDMVNIRDVGFGVSQTLPILVALRVAREGQLVYLEEPEIHLHPRAQVKLADILADAAKRGVRVVAETHSSLLLRAVQTLVARQELSPELVRLHWFKLDKHGVTRVKSVTPDQRGAFGKWPQDFGDVALDSEQDYLDAVESQLSH
jgi:hypothetical protein